MRAKLFSNFPLAYIKKTIIKKLLKHDITVDQILPCKAVDNCDLSEIDVVLVMYDLASHNEGRQAQNAAKREGKKIFFLPRRESLWDKILSPR